MLSVAIKEQLFSGKSKYQQIEVFDTVSFGRMLVLDGVIMVTEFDNHAYHEMIVHVPMQSHPNPQKVLVIGGGDGGTLKELLKYKSVKEAWICEIDEEVINISKTYFPNLAEAFEDERVRVNVGDGALFMKENPQQFDVICVDSSDPIGPAEVLFTKEFYQDIQRSLTADGIATTQSESMYYHNEFIGKLYAQNKKIFSYTDYYYTMIPTYPSGTIGYSFCSNKYNAFDNLKSNRLAEIKDLSYYSQEIHRAAFVLPEFARKAIKGK